MTNEDKEFIKQFSKNLTINEMVEYFNNKYTKKRIKNYYDNYGLRSVFVKDAIPLRS
jgi:hypothetical protein